MIALNPKPVGVPRAFVSVPTAFADDLLGTVGKRLSSFGLKADCKMAMYARGRFVATLLRSAWTIR